MELQDKETERRKNVNASILKTFLDDLNNFTRSPMTEKTLAPIQLR